MKNKFKIATYNLWKNCGLFPQRIDSIAQYLTKLDCICFQEDYHSDSFSSSDIINNRLNLYKVTLPIRQKQRDGILSSSNLTILSKHEITILDGLIFNKIGEDERGAQIVQVTINETKIIIVNTHLTNLSQQLRMDHIEIIRLKLQDYTSEMIVICGDMNSTPQSKEIRKIQRCGYNSINQEVTYEGKLILDYIFYKSNFEVKIKSKIIIKNLSDHHCLKNSFRLLDEK